MSDHVSEWIETVKRIWRRPNEQRESSPATKQWSQSPQPTSQPSARQTPSVSHDEQKRHRHLSTKEAIRRFRTHATHDRHSSVMRIGIKDALWSDMYHHALTANWVPFCFWAFVSYLAINLFFGGLYALIPDGVTSSHPLSFADMVFFSVQTLSTIGYGGMLPNGTTANIVVSIEALLGMAINALAAGAIFARIARPKARILFSDSAVISDETGVPALCIRIANCRRSLILSVDIEVALSRLIVTHDGYLERHFEPLTLIQAHVPVLRYTFMLAHIVTESSPLHHHSLEELKKEEAEIIVTVAGTDEAMGQAVYARTSYAFDRVLHNHRFVDIIHTHPNGGLSVDYSKFHDIEAYRNSGPATEDEHVH